MAGVVMGRCRRADFPGLCALAGAGRFYASKTGSGTARNLCHFEPTLWQGIAKNIDPSNTYMVNGTEIPRYT